MIKRTITETICEYDKEGKLVRKTVTETKEEEDNTTLTYPSNFPSANGSSGLNGYEQLQPYITYCNEVDPINTATTNCACSAL